VNLILFCMQEHYRLPDGVNIIFNNATWEVIKDAFKHACYISIASYYMQMNLLPFYTHVLKLLIFLF
jgi:hypothetical protein